VEVFVQQLIHTESAAAFFSRALGEALSIEHVEVSGLTHSYVVHVLVREVRDGHHPDETLADRFVLAGQAPSVERTDRYRSVGDAALMLSGLWWERAAHRRGWPEIRYAAALGSRSYRAIGGEPYDEMSEKFEGLVSALVRFGTAQSLATARDVLRLYQLWHQTRSRCAAEALADHGVFVSRGSTLPS
jgi:hypothetical protein